MRPVKHQVGLDTWTAPLSRCDTDYDRRLWYPGERVCAVIRNAIRVAAISLATLAIPVTALTMAPPASASGARLCELWASNHYCLGSANTDYYTAIVTKSTGRNLVLTALGGTYQGAPTFLLQFSAQASDCVGVSNDLSHVEIKPCNGGTGTVWALPQSDPGRFINRYATEQNGTDIQYLTGKNVVDERFFTAKQGACCGDYEVFHWVS
jgi:hypothetical protein